MSKKSFLAAAEAATEALLNAQRVDASVITDECGNVAIRKASLERYGDYCRGGEGDSGQNGLQRRRMWRQARLQALCRDGREEIYRDYPYLAWCPENLPQRVFASFSFPKDMNKSDILKYLYKEVLEIKGKAKHFKEEVAWEQYK